MLVGFRIDAPWIVTTACLTWWFPGWESFPVLVDTPCNSVQGFRTKVIKIGDGRRDKGWMTIETIEHPHTAWTDEAHDPDALEGIDI